MTQKETINAMAQQAIAPTPKTTQAVAGTFNFTSFNKAITSEKTSNYLTQVLGERKGDFVNNLIALVSSDKSLQECKPTSLIYSAIKATALDFPLDKSLGLAWVIAYKEKDVPVAQFQIGYKGFVQLAIRSGQFKHINAIEVRDGEIESEDMLTGEIKFKFHERNIRKTIPVIGYAAYIETLNGFSKTMYMTAEEMQAHAMEYSQTYKSSKEWVRKSSMWTKDFDAMAKKTILKLLLSKYGLLSTRIQQAVQYDQASFDEDNTPKYVDNIDDADVQDAEIVDEKTQTE